MRHPRREVREHIIDRNPHSLDSWLSPALARLNDDDVLILHADSISGERRLKQQSLIRNPLECPVTTLEFRTCNLQFPVPEFLLFPHCLRRQAGVCLRRVTKSRWHYRMNILQT